MTESPTPITGAEFSRIAGVSRTIISRMAGELKLTKNLNGKYDLSDPKNYNYLLQRETKKKGVKAPKLDKGVKQPKPKPITPKKKPQNTTVIIPPEDRQKLAQSVEDEAEAKARKAIADADLAEYKARNEQIKLDSLERRIIKTDEAEFLFFGFLDKTTQEALRASKTMLTRIEHAITDNSDPADAAREVTIILRNEIESIIRQTKKDQKISMKEYYENQGSKKK